MVASSKNLHRAIQDIKYVNLNAPLLPDDMDPIITTLDDNVADICNLSREDSFTAFARACMVYLHLVTLSMMNTTARAWDTHNSSLAHAFSCALRIQGQRMPLRG